ncbi:MAG: CPBP family intramembrane glutamic endopeptidase [Chloroflexota bacterium]
MALVDEEVLPAGEPRGALAGVAGAARHLAGALWSSRLLLAYVVLGLLAGLEQGGEGLLPALVNHLILLPAYVLLIYLWTRGAATAAQTLRSAAPRSGSRWRDLGLAGALLALNTAVVVSFWADGPPVLLMDWARAGLLGAGWVRELANVAANGFSQTLFVLLPALALALLVFRLRPWQVGLAPRGLGLGLVLVASGIAIAGLLQLGLGRSTPLFRSPELVPLALALFGAQLFVNGLPEEFIFRGGILSRLLAQLRNPHHALVLVSVLFVAAHIPSQLAGGGELSLWTFWPAGAQPTGLVWGYLYYRTRSIWPGALWHASNYTLAVLFLG